MKKLKSLAGISKKDLFNPRLLSQIRSKKTESIRNCFGENTFNLIQHNIIFYKCKFDDIASKVAILKVKNK